MKSKLIAIVAAVVAIGLTGCKDNDLMYNPGQPGRLYFNDYFKPSEPILFATEIFSFAFETEDEAEYLIKLGMMGMPQPYDRTFEIMLAPDDITTYQFGEEQIPVFSAVKDTDFEVVSCIVPANQIYGMVTLKLKRTEKIFNQYASLVISVKDGSGFLAYPDNRLRLLLIDGDPPCPPWWITEVSGRSYQWILPLGEFKVYKYKKFLEIYWSIEQTNPVFYYDMEDKYGRYLDKKQYDEDTGEYTADIKMAFMATDRISSWTRYTLIPLYEWCKEEYPLGEDYTKGTSAAAGGWRDPIAYYR